MKKKLIFPLTTLCARLERAIHADVGMKGLNILLYGWKMKSHIIKEHTMHIRRQETGEPYLTWLETQAFSYYCGYDLTHD